MVQNRYFKAFYKVFCPKTMCRWWQNIILIVLHGQMMNDGRTEAKMDFFHLHTTHTTGNSK